MKSTPLPDHNDLIEISNTINLVHANLIEIEKLVSSKSVSWDRVYLLLQSMEVTLNWIRENFFPEPIVGLHSQRMIEEDDRALSFEITRHYFEQECLKFKHVLRKIGWWRRLCYRLHQRIQ
jgi:hypothetical protein